MTTIMMMPLTIRGKLDVFAFEFPPTPALVTAVVDAVMAVGVAVTVPVIRVPPINSGSAVIATGGKQSLIEKPSIKEARFAGTL
jgi:hypothetical protein